MAKPLRYKARNWYTVSCLRHKTSWVTLDQSLSALGRGNGKPVLKSCHKNCRKLSSPQESSHQSPVTSRHQKKRIITLWITLPKQSWTIAILWNSFPPIGTQESYFMKPVYFLPFQEREMPFIIEFTTEVRLWKDCLEFPWCFSHEI